MKKWMALAVSSLFAVTAQAQEFTCGYKDYFRLSDKSHPGIYIVSASSDQDINLQVIGPRSFLIRDGSNCVSGFAHVTVAYDQNHWCVLDLKDGPYMNHPIVKASCNGIRYTDTSYDGFGSYSYSINLD